tara:strand:+ start:13044 stop:13358 length:315 start_codon:yes stop_codon:yes gene_type:complete
MFPLDLSNAKDKLLFGVVTALLVLLLVSSSISISDYNALLSVQDSSEQDLSDVNLDSLTASDVPTLQTALLQLEGSNGWSIFVVILVVLIILGSSGMIIYDKFK